MPLIPFFLVEIKKTHFEFDRPLSLGSKRLCLLDRQHLLGVRPIQTQRAKTELRLGPKLLGKTNKKIFFIWITKTSDMSLFFSFINEILSSLDQI